jgi:hypothetical protein
MEEEIQLVKGSFSMDSSSNFNEIFHDVSSLKINEWC